MARRRSGEREHYWRGIIREQETSGLSVSAFCREREVSQASFFNWRGKLAPGPAVDAAAKFVPIAVAHSSPAEPSFEVLLPGGLRVVVPPRFDADSLRELIGVLETKSC